MKISRKMNKFVVSFLATTLSIIMFVTSASALTPITYNGYFEHEGVIEALEYINWDPRDKRKFLSFGLDLLCYECENVDYVQVSMSAMAGYYSSVTAEEHFDYDSDSRTNSFYPWNTEDSDEFIIYITDFDNRYPKTELIVTILFEIFYSNGDRETYQYEHSATIIGEQMINTEPRITEHVYIFNVDNENQ